MSRYFTRPRKSLGIPRHPRAGYDPEGWNPLIPSLEVDDHVPVDAGLVDHRGDPILRAPETMGFHHPRVKP